MANVQGTFYRGETQRRGVNPVSPPNAVDDPVTPVNPPGSGSTTTYKQLGDTADKSFVGKDWHTPVVEDENILRLHPWVRDTGVIAFEGAVFNSATTVDIGAVKAFIADNETDPLNPTLLYVEYAGATNVTVPTVGAGLISYAFLKSDGTIHFQNNPPNSDERKSMVLIFKLGHPTGSINVVANEPDFNNSALQQFRDLFQAFNYINGGVYPYPDASDLSFNTSGGFIVGNGINFVQDNTNPNYSPVSPSVPCSFLYRTQTGVGGGFISLITPNSYDNSGTITTVGGGSNRTTIQYIFFAPNAGFIVQYGQTIYDSFVDAISAVGKEDFVVYENLIKNAILIGVLVVKRSATDLTNENDARFFRADIFGQLIGSAAGTSVTTLQRAYLNSIIPQIETSIGALTLKNGGGADTDSVFSIENIASAETFAVRGDGVISEGTISPYQLIQEGATDGQVLTWVAANSRYEPVAGGGGGADANAVHYNAADSKTATEKQQARDNIGLDSGIAQEVTTDASINTLTRTNNQIIFTGATANRNLSGVTAGTQGERILIWNKRSFNVGIINNAGVSGADGFSVGANQTVRPGDVFGFIYDTIIQRWVFDQAGLDKYLRKSVADIKEFQLDIYPLGSGSTNRVSIKESGGRTAIEGTRSGSYNPAIKFDTNSFYLGNDKGSASIWGLHIYSDDKLHLARATNGGTSTIATGYTIKSWEGHYFEGDASLLGLTIRVVSVTTSGAINDLDLSGSSNARLTAATSLTGVVPTNGIGKRLIIQNDNTVSLDLPHQSASSIAANRFNWISGATLSIPTKGKIEIIYCTGSRWELVSKNF